MDVNSHDIFQQLKLIGIVPVISIDDAEKAVPLAKALKAGGIPCAEITLRTSQGEEAIRRIADELPDVLLGAGTVLTEEQADRAVAAGASFVVSPGFNPKVVARCQEKGVPSLPGCATPSDMERAMEMGLSTVKFFPAEQCGGLEYIKAVSAPYPGLSFIPTGGINASNIRRYLAFSKIAACGGSWMVPAVLMDRDDFASISGLCMEAMGAALGLRMASLSPGAPGERCLLTLAAADRARAEAWINRLAPGLLGNTPDGGASFGIALTG